MCYSAQVHAEYSKFRRETGAGMDLDSYLRIYWWQEEHDHRRPKVLRAAERDILANGPRELADEIRHWDAWEIDQLTQRIFDQRQRVAEGERALARKQTKKALEDVRIGTKNYKAARRRLETLKGKVSELDSRIFPGVYCPVLVSEGGRLVVKLMRYQCRPAGKPASYDRRYPGTYNARRDNLEGYWEGLFGRNHAVMVADRFYEHVEVDGENRVLEFSPRTGEPMFVACLWSNWTDPRGKDPDLLSFAAITDEPEPEVAAAGHDRTIINIRPEHVDAWLNPDPNNLEVLYRIFDDRQHPYYEHRIAA